MSISLNDDQIQQAVSAAILQTITKENRDLLIQKALESLLQRPKPRYQSDPKPPSKLEEIFNGAVFDYARNHIRDILEEDPKFKEAIRALVGKAVERIALDDGELSVQLASALTSALKKDY